ncbi:uncharacterized protein LOC116265442 [Nymphaea colorata]|nr:uncharacterized protein LOC116265442 [Nymphaea colorata]
MEPGAGTPNSNSNAGVPSSQQYSDSVGKAPAYVPLQPINTPLMQHAIALQQYHFQQSLLNQQLLAQQQAAANAVSVKAAAEEAAARAAQISKFLTGEKAIEGKGNTDEPCLNRERSESQSRPHSPSITHSSKSRSRSRSISSSPVRHRTRRSERERYSSRGFSSYRSRRYYRYGNRGYDNFYSSSRRRDFDRRYHDKDYASYRRKRSRSRSRSRGSRSLSRSKTEKHLLDRSSSWRRGPYRSRSPISDHSTERRLHRISRSPINSSSHTPSPEQSKGSDKRFTGKQSLTPSDGSQNSSGRHHAGSVSRDDDGVTNLQKNDWSEQMYRHREHDISNGKKLSRNDHSSSSVRSGSISTSHSGEKVMESTERSPKLVRSAPESGNCSSHSGSDEEVVSMSLEASEDENMPSKVGDQYHDQKNTQSWKLSGSGKTSDDLGASTSRREKSFEPKVERSYRSEGREPDSRSSHLQNDAGHNLKSTNHVKDSDCCRKIVAEGQIDEIKDQHLLENITEDGLISHSTGRDEYAGLRQEKTDTSSEAGEDMNMNLLPYPTTVGPEKEKESDELERIDDDLNAQIATKRHGKRRSKRRSKSRDRRSKHGKSRHKKHKRKYSDENLKNRHGKHQEEELEGDRHKRVKRERSEEYEKHYRRHKGEDPEETENRHDRKHRRDDSDEDDFLDKSRRRMKRHRSHRKHTRSHKERKQRRKHRDTSSSSSDEYSSSSKDVSSDPDT